MPHLVDPYRYATAASGTLSAAIGGFNAPSSSVTGTTCSVTGLAFQPKLVILWMTGRTETSDAAALSRGNAQQGFGFFDASGQYGWGVADIDANTSSNVGSIHRTDCCILKSGFGIGAQQNYRGLNFSSMNSDGFTLAIDSHDTRAWAGERIHYLALGGTKLSNTKVGSASGTAALGNESYTPLAFTPTALLFANLNKATNTFGGTLDANIGAATGASNQWNWGGSAVQNVNPADTWRYMLTTECMSMMATSGAGPRCRFVSLDATGWTFNRLEASSSFSIPYAALGGVDAVVSSFTASSGGGTISGLPFAPVAVLFMTHGTTASTADASASEYLFSIGAAVSGSQLCAHVRDSDNVGPTRVVRAHRDDSVVVTSDNASSPAVNSRVALSALTADGFTYTMPTSTLNGYLVGYVALG